MKRVIFILSLLLINTKIYACGNNNDVDTLRCGEYYMTYQNPKTLQSTFIHVPSLIDQANKLRQENEDLKLSIKEKVEIMAESENFVIFKYDNQIYTCIKDQNTR